MNWFSFAHAGLLEFVVGIEVGIGIGIGVEVEKRTRKKKKGWEGGGF